MTVKPLLKWVGGKRAMLPYLQSPPKFNRYIEPFFGGGAKFFSMEFPFMGKGKVHLINDSNTALMLFYKLVEKFPEMFVEKLGNLTDEYVLCTDKRAMYYSLREEFNGWLDDVDLSVDEVDFAVIFYAINKLSFNGLYRVNRKNMFNTPFGSHPVSIQFDEANFWVAIQKLRKTQIMSDGYENAIMYAQKGDFVFIDPPYWGTFTSYTRLGFDNGNHEILASEVLGLDEVGVHVLLTNTDCPEVRELYDGFNITPLTQNNSINSKSSGRKNGRKDIVISNYDKES